MSCKSCLQECNPPAALQQGQPDPGDESESHEVVENLLESYFMQIDSAYDRLDAIGEYIEDTEEYINIELDSSRNRLLRLEIVLTAGTFGIAMFGLVAGMQTNSDYLNSQTAPYQDFGDNLQQLYTNQRHCCDCFWA